MKKILLTGATGFIGRACLRVFQNTDFEVHALFRHRPIADTDINWHQCDILDPIQVSKIMDSINPDYLIHSAWYVEHKLFWSSEKNIDYIPATINLYKKFSFNGGKKAIFLGTCAEYAPNYSHCDEETTPLLPTTLYGIAKKQTFELLTQLNKDCPRYAPFSWVRIFNLFGPDENPERLVPYILNSYLQNNPPVLNNPFAIRDHLFVDNLAKAILFLINSDIVGAINVGQNNQYSIAEIAELIHRRHFPELPPPIHATTIKTNNDSLIPKLEKLKNLNINFDFTFEEGLDKALKWWITAQKKDLIHSTI